MKFSAQIQSFRARLLLLLALMLGLTLGIQYYFNLRTVRANARMIIEQEQAIMTGIALGLESLQSDQYLDEIIGSLREPLLNDKNVRVKNILVVDDDGNVRDSVIPEFNPREREDKTLQLRSIQRHPASAAEKCSAVHERSTNNLPSWIPPSTNVDFGEAGAFYFPVQTDKGRRFIIVVLDSAHTLDQCSGATVVAFGALHARRVVCDDARYRVFRLALHSSDQGTLNRGATGRRR